jgi:hypothetical protein
MSASSGVRDPYTIANIDLVTAWARQQIVERLGDSGYELHFTVYGRNAILGDSEPLKGTPAHELGIVVQGVGPTKRMAEEACMIATRQMFYARLPQVKGTAGGVAFLLDEVMPANPAYQWTLNHTMRVDNPLELFPTSKRVALLMGDRVFESLYPPARSQQRTTRFRHCSELAHNLRSYILGLNFRLTSAHSKASGQIS